MSKNVIEVPKPRTKTQDVDSDNLNQTLEPMHVCDKTTSEDSFEKIFIEKPIKEPDVDVPVFDTFIDNILNDMDFDSGDSSYEGPIVRKENVVEDAENIGNNIPRDE